MRKCIKILLMSCLMVSSLYVVMPSTAVADKREEILKKIRDLEQKKAQLRKEVTKKTDESKPGGKSLGEIIARYEKLLSNCTVKKSERCADVIYTLGGLYYDRGRDNYIKARENYERQMGAYEKNPQGPEPVNPVPDYSQALAMYERLANEYPEFPKLSEAYYQMGTIYLLMGDMDKTKDAFTMVVEKYPKSPRASGAHFRLSDLCYLDHDNSCAIKHLEKIIESEVDVQTWEMVHYRKAEMYYTRGEFDKAVNLFQTYVEKCDAGLYPKREFRDMALEFMAISFSDMGNGAQEAVNFFKKIGHKPYEPYVMYTIGIKNRTHGQFDEAIKALTLALKKFPYYKDAPVARQDLIDCYVVKKQHEKANEEREKLVDDYGPGSKWYEKNSGESAVIEQSRNEIRRALSNIAIYYHAIAQKKKSKELYQKALKRYQEYFDKFPDDKWRIYEFNYNVAEIYGALGDCKNSAKHYNFVAMADLSTYPEYQPDIDTVGTDQEELEKQKKGRDKGPVVISQEDAGYNVIVALDNCRKQKIAAEGLSEEKAYALPETQQLLEYTSQFQARFPKSSNAAEVLYLAGNIHYAAKAYDKAAETFKQVGDLYPSAKITEKAMRMLANSHTSAGQYDMAMGIFRKLLAKQEPNTPEYVEVLDLAAGSMFKRAESIKKKGDLAGAADAYKMIYNEYPTSKVADRGWFEAAVCYEEQKNYEVAASVFLELPGKFPKSTLREKAFIRAAEAYKKVEKWDLAAQAYQAGANAITKAEFAIPSLSSASECYQKIDQFDMAGKMFEMIYDRYQSDPKTPQALYNAGLIFEKGKLYSNAINVYDILAKRFTESEYAAEALFSIGLCYEKMEQNENMASVFTEFANKFAKDRYKQVQALVKAGDAYFKLQKYEAAGKNYLDATSIYEKFKKEADIDVGNVAQAYFMLGEVYYKTFEKIKLTANNEKAMKELIKKKTKALEDPAKYYAKAIELGVAEWTVRATYMIGMGFVDMAEAVANQTLFGRAEQKIASKIKILSSLDKYYEKAQEYFYKNIDWAHNQNIKGEYVEKSIDRFCEMMYQRGHIMEQVGIEFASAPIPRGLTDEEVQAYKELLEEKKLESMDAALPKYEEGVKAAQQLQLGQNQWIDKIKARIGEINPQSTALSIQITEWVPDQSKTPSSSSPAGTDQADMSGGGSTSASSGDEELDRNMRRIQNIMGMQISSEEKIRQLNRIEMEAQRNIVLEEEKIKELKEKM
ncbi:MAG: tetratricopeptide repeat protein [Chitinispirillaceae bacterium]|nr:tetratricopeptide repeat protein [Chitinispirillaceae bacterium]